MVQYSEFFLFEGKCARGAVEVVTHGSVDNGVSLMLGEENAPSNLKYKVVRGKKFHDVIFTDWATVLVSKKIVDAFSKYGITGWDTYDAPLESEGDIIDDKYFGFVIKGRCGPIDNLLSRKTYYPPPVPGGLGHQGLKGLYFDLTTWDSSDIFSPAGTALIMIHKKVKVVLEKIRASNVLITPISEAENLVV